MKTRTRVVAVATALTVFLYHHHAAFACGGCFAPPETITSVDSHRMVIALSVNKTVLWDQIRYTGNPEDFVWVLPVPSADTTLGVASSDFFDALEEQTAPVISPPALPPPPDCPPPPWGSNGAVDAGAASVDANVEVYREETVGPYETVVIGSADAGALVSWLNAHGYNVPAATLPVISHYTALGSKFVVLRLAPEQGVSAMQPIRVEYPGYMATFPLKMVTVGAYGTLALTLWVMAEQRYEARNYGTVEVPRWELVWDFATNTSNYKKLFRDAIDNSGGKAWVAEAARPLAQLYFADQSEVSLIRSLIPNAFLTRLRTDQLVDHLAQDLELAPSPDSSQISSFIPVTNSVNQPPTPTCPDWDGDGYPDTWETRGHGTHLFGCNTSHGAGGAAVIGLIVLFAIGRRRRLADSSARIRRNRAAGTL